MLAQTRDRRGRRAACRSLAARIETTDAQVVAIAEELSYAVTIITRDPHDINLLVGLNRRANIAVDAREPGSRICRLVEALLKRTSDSDGKATRWRRPFLTEDHYRQAGLFSAPTIKALQISYNS